MRKKYRWLPALWCLAVLLLAGLLSGCGSGTQNDRNMPSVTVIETEGAAPAAGRETVSETPAEAGSGEVEETSSTRATETDAGNDETEPLSAGNDETEPLDAGTDESEPAAAEIDEDGSYTSKDEVALYLYTYGHLPDNFITKNEAKKLGWDNSKGNLAEVAPGKSIGGDRFGNYEELLPEKDGRKWTECDIGYEEGYRNGERIVFSNDGLIYYTGDHYKSFEQLY